MILRDWFIVSFPAFGRLLFEQVRHTPKLLIAAAGAAWVGLSALASEASATIPLYDPVVLNIGISCQWQQNCQRQQMKAMLAANRFIAGNNPPVWRIHVCNRNARRSAARADWIGFNACIRNPRLTPPPALFQRAKARRHVGLKAAVAAR